MRNNEALEVTMTPRKRSLFKSLLRHRRRLLFRRNPLLLAPPIVPTTTTTMTTRQRWQHIVFTWFCWAPRRCTRCRPPRSRRSGCPRRPAWARPSSACIDCPGARRASNRGFSSTAEKKQGNVLKLVSVYPWVCAFIKKISVLDPPSTPLLLPPPLFSLENSCLCRFFTPPYCSPPRVYKRLTRGKSKKILPHHFRGSAALKLSYVPRRRQRRREGKGMVEAFPKVSRKFIISEIISC